MTCILENIFEENRAFSIPLLMELKELFLILVEATSPKNFHRILWKSLDEYILSTYIEKTQVSTFLT